MRDHAKRICAGSISLLRSQPPIYCDRRNTLPGHAQCVREYSGGYLVHVREDGHSFQLGDANSDEKCRRSTPSPQGDGDVLVFPTPFSSL